MMPMLGKRLRRMAVHPWAENRIDSPEAAVHVPTPELDA